jgi:RHS repeat-associated protein
MLYIHGGRVDEIVKQIRVSDGWERYFQHDARGNCIFQTDGSGNLMEAYEYDAFGQPYVFDAGSNYLGDSPWGNRFLFTGREWLKDLWIYDYRNRMYHPELGRFLQPDPLHFKAGDYNLYRYCHNDPVNKNDPSGLGPERDFIVGFDHAATGGIASGIVNAFDPSYGASVDTGSAAYSYGSKAGFLPGGLRTGAGKLAALGAKVYRKYAPFSKTTKDQAKEANRQKNDGKMRDARTGEEVQPAQQSQKGVRPPDNEAHVDHIQPRSKGGDNSPENAQILSRKENLKKGDN